MGRCGRHVPTADDSVVVPTHGIPMRSNRGHPVPGGRVRVDGGCPITSGDTEERLERLLRGSAARFVHAGTRAIMTRQFEDTITLPPRAVLGRHRLLRRGFPRAGSLTGYATRLNWPFTGQRDAPAYAREELRAELASAFLGAELGIAHDLEPTRLTLMAIWSCCGTTTGNLPRGAGRPGIAELILDRHPTWRLQDGVCVARTETGGLDDEADAHRQRVIEAPTATDDPAARPDGHRRRPSRGAFTGGPSPPSTTAMRSGRQSARRLSRRVDDALPLSTHSRRRCPSFPPRAFAPARWIPTVCLSLT